MHRILILALLALALLPAAAFAQQVAPAAALPAWEQLSDAQREQLIAPIRDRWNSAPASDKAARIQPPKRFSPARMIAVIVCPLRFIRRKLAVRSQQRQRITFVVRNAFNCGFVLPHRRPEIASNARRCERCDAYGV